jgi:cytochrome c oxidase subunit I
MRAVNNVATGIAMALIGLYLGIGGTAAVRALAGEPAWDSEMNIAIGWVFAVMGWLMGVGMWKHWSIEWFGGTPKPFKLTGWQRYFGFSGDHKVIGVQYLVSFIVVFILAGFLAMLIRAELAQAGEDFLNNDRYNTVMSLHGIMMIAVAVAAVIGGLGNYAVPILIGSDDMAFPRLNAMTFWMIPPVVVTLLAIPFLDGLESGWTAYPPLSVLSDGSQTMFNLAIMLFGLTSIFGGLNFIVTVIFLRAPGMTWGRLPIFVWSMFVTSFLALFFTQGFFLGLLMVLLDRIADMSFFDAAEGGAPLLYQHVFWFYSHPAVYIMVLPGFGVALEVIAHFSRKPLYAYPYAVAAFIMIAALSAIVWAHHMFTSGMPSYLHGPFLVTTELISIPTGLIFLAALGTVWRGRLYLQVPMLFALAVIFNFGMGGITGIFLADVPTDIHLQDTYFVVAHFHYTIMGGEIFALFAGIYYWFPKITGRMYNEMLARVHFWWMFIGFNVTFFIMHYPGIQGMNRRIADYPAAYETVNLIVSISSFLLGASFILFLANMIYSWAAGKRAVANPWKIRTLEWQTPSPPPHDNFPAPPVVTGHPYDYGVKGSVHGFVPEAPPSGSPAGGSGGGR